MKVIDQILLEWSFRCPDGIVDINDSKKKAILDEILKEFNIELDEVDSTDALDSTKKTSSKINFNTFIAQKTMKEETKTEVIDSLSPDQKAKILKSASDNINNIIKFLNDNSDISNILTPITEGKSGTSLTGPGEIAIIVCGKNVKKIESGFGDIVELSGKKYELKADKEIRAGGTYRPSVVRLTTTLWNLKQEVFEGPNKEEYKNILGPELFKTWESLGLITRGKEKGQTAEIDFTTIGKEKLSKIKDFLTSLREKIKNISDEDTPKPNVIAVGGKEFEVEKDELEKIGLSEPGENVVVKGKVVLSQDSNKELQQIRQQLKILLSSKILTSDEYDLEGAIKDDFIKDVDGLIHVVKNKYTLYSQKEFKEKWRFTGIKQGNRPTFAPLAMMKEIEFKE